MALNMKQEGDSTPPIPTDHIVEVAKLDWDDEDMGDAEGNDSEL